MTVKYSAPFAVCGAFFGFVIASHLFAVFRLNAMSPDDSNRRLLRCARLVESVHEHAWWIAAYALFVSFMLGFSIARKHPRWCVWLLLSAFMAPWFYYVFACVYIAAAGR